MRAVRWLAFIGAASLLPCSLPALAATDVAAVAAAAYGDYSLSVPTPSSVTICHGFGCKYRSEVWLSSGDRAVLARLLATGKASAAAERRAVGAAGAWFDRHIAPAAGTQGHVAHAGYTYMYDKGQFDCIDASRNTTSLLLVLDELKLLRHHDVAEPVARGFLIDGPPHVTAVMVERATSTKWAVDAWTRSYGQAPEIMPLALWKTLE